MSRSRMTNIPKTESGDAIRTALDDLALCLSTLRSTHPDCGRIVQLDTARAELAALLALVKAVDVQLGNAGPVPGAKIAAIRAARAKLEA